MQLDINKLITAVEEHTNYTLNLEEAGRNIGLPHIVWELLGSVPDIAMGETQNNEFVTFRLTVFADSCIEAEEIHKSIAGSFDLGLLTLTGYTTIRCDRTDSTLKFVDGTWQATLNYLLQVEEA